MALKLFEFLVDANLNGNPHHEGDRYHMTDEQVARFKLEGKVREVKKFEAAPADEPAPESEKAE